MTVIQNKQRDKLTGTLSYCASVFERHFPQQKKQQQQQQQHAQQPVNKQHTTTSA
jgi:Tfp pilus assembly protein PilE